MANTYPASGFACIDGVYSDVRVSGYPGGNDGVLFMCIASNDYQAIRGYDGNLSTIHFFGTNWANCTLGNSVGSINIEGRCGVTFGAWNTPQMVIRKSDGNVGIGTSSPTEGLVVATGAFRVTSQALDFSAGTRGISIDTTAGNVGRIYTVTGTGTATDLTFGTNNSERLRITTGGNVGIGTTSITASRLRVEGATSENNSIADFISNDTSSPSTYHRGIRVLAPSLPTGDKILMSVGVADNSRNMGQLYFNYVGDQSTSNFLSLGLFAVDEVLNITGAGRVGIGTTSPSYLLQVESSSPRVHIKGTSGDAGLYMKASTSSGGWTVKDNGSNEFTIYSDSASSHRLYINSTGNVGIGTTSPSNTLTVNGNIGLGGYNWMTRSDGDGNWGFGLCNNSSTYYTFLSYAPDPTADRRGGIFNIAGNSWIAYGNCCSHFIVTNSLGIGTTTPSYKLHVNGTFYAAGSSQDYKEGICQYNTDSCLFMCLKPKAYQYKEEWKHLGKDLKSGTQIGLIAEEVAESHPELAVLVNEEDNQVVRNVDYEKLSIILLAEVQKLRQEVDQLNQK